MKSDSSAKTFFQSSLGSIALYGVPIALRFLTTMGVIPIYTRVLKPADYGVLELLDFGAFVIGSLIGSNFGVAVFYYHAAAKTAEAKDRTLSTAFWGSFLLAAITLIPLWSAEWLSGVLIGSGGYGGPLRLSIGAVALSFPTEVALCCLRVRERISQYVVLSSGRMLVTTAVTLVLLLGFQMGLESLLWSSLVVTAGLCIVAGWMNRGHLSAGFDSNLFLQQLKYSWPLSVSALATLVLDFGDRYVLRRHVSLDEVGIYGLAYKFGMVVSMCSLVFNHYWKPKMYSVVQEPNGHQLYARMYTYYLFALSGIVVAIATVGVPLIRLLVGEKFHSALVLVPWVAVLYLVRVTGDFFRNAFYLAKRTFQEAQAIWLGAFLCVGAYFVFIPPFQLWGAILATGVSFLSMWVLSLWWGQRTMRFPFQFRRIALCFVWTGVIVGITQILPAMPLGARVATGAALLACWPLALWASGWLDPAEQYQLRSVTAAALGRLRPSANAGG